MKILITAFEPFGKCDTNVALMALNKIKAKDYDIETLEVETVYSRAFSTVKEKLDTGTFDYCICLGQAGGRDNITVERIAINIADCSAPDNNGKILTDQKISQTGQLAYLSTLPIKKIVNKVNKNGIPCKISDTAGTYVCNYIFYSLMNYLEGNTKTKGGFIHLPYATEQKQDGPSLPLDDIVKALEVILEYLANL